MNFNPDPNKKAQEIIFSRKINKIKHPSLLFNQNLVKSFSSQKHLGKSKVNKITGLLRKLQNILPRQSLITTYIIYDRACSSSFHQNIESIQWNAALAITGAIRGTSKEKIYQELGFESLQQRR